MTNKKPTHTHRYSNLLSILHRQKDFLGRIFGGSHGLQIHLRNQTLHFDNLGSFKAFLSEKTEIPDSKIQKMLGYTSLHLESEVQQLSKLEKRIDEKLAATIRDPRSIDNYLDEATMVRFSQDYDWRQIMFELSKQPSDFSEYKLEAVTYYQRYLRSRIKIASSIIQEQSQLQENNGNTRLPDPPSAHDPAPDKLQARQDGQPIEGGNLKAFAQTSADLLSQEGEDIPDSGFTRIPRGETVIVDPIPPDTIPIKIASRVFTLKMSKPPKLISENGDSYSLKQGENMIGRSRKCAIVANPEFVDISRQHLIIELDPDEGALRFTDLSSSGTQLPTHLIKD